MALSSFRTHNQMKIYGQNILFVINLTKVNKLSFESQRLLVYVFKTTLKGLDPTPLITSLQQLQIYQL